MTMKNSFVLKASELKEIDHDLSRFNLNRLDHFFYYPSEFLFDSVVVLFHFRYSSNGIRHGIVKHFRHCLSHGHGANLHSLHTEMSLKYLQYLHHVNDHEV